MIPEYESYTIVKWDEEVRFDNLEGCTDDPDFDYDGNDEPFQWQVLGEVYSMHRETWYEVVAGLHTESQAKRYVEALERAGLLIAHITKSLASTLETVRTCKEDKTMGD